MTTTGAADRMAVTSRDLRRASADRLLRILRSDGIMTASELMTATGLSRPAIHKVCADLIALGWIRVAPAPAPETIPSPSTNDPRGRPPRYYAFAADAGAIVSVDFGVHTVRATVADLSGKALASVENHIDDPTGADRAHVLEAATTAVLGAAGISPGHVKVATVGVPMSLSSNAEIRYPDYQSVIEVTRRWAGERGWPVRIENDANLAALGEHRYGVARDEQNVIVLLAGERLGAGIIAGGTLLLGAHASAGEMRFLSLIPDVYAETVGAGWHTRELAERALAEGWATDGLRRARDEAGGHLGAPAVFRAATHGDESAQTIVRIVCERLARIVGVLATIIDPALVVLAGGIADAGDLLAMTTHSMLPTWMIDNPPRIATSTLGSNAVVAGGVSLALDYLDVHALDTNP